MFAFFLTWPEQISAPDNQGSNDHTQGIKHSCIKSVAIEERAVANQRLQQSGEKEDTSCKMPTS